MEARATAKFVRVTPRKADQVLRLIRGQRVDRATELLLFTPKHVARVIGKVLHSAVANAVASEGKINIEQLRVKRAVADAGPTMKRFLPRAQGRATPLLKRTSHITVVVEGEALIEEQAPARRAARVKQAPARASKKAAAAKPETEAAEQAAETKKKPARRAASKRKSKEA